MRIAYDAKRITHNGTGLGNYGRTLINILATHYPQNNYLLFTPDKGKEALRKQVLDLSAISFIYPRKKKRGIGKALWRSYGIVKDLAEYNISLFHGLSGELPFGLKKKGIKSIVTIHDLIFLHYPQYYNRIDKLIYTYKFKKACRNADRIIAISEMTKRDIISYFDIAADKIDVVYQGCDESFKQEVSQRLKEEVKAKYHLPDNYILYLGSIEERKNLLLVLKALKYVKEPIHLVAAGKRTSYTETIEKYIQENKLMQQVTLLHGVPFADLPSLYQMASLFVYPSRFEGFGIPIIEAIHSGLPVIAATGSCLEEAGGPGSIYIHPDNEKELADSINLILADKSLRRQMIQTGKEYVSRFEEDLLAEDMMRVYQTTIKISKV